MPRRLFHGTRVLTTLVWCLSPSSHLLILANSTATATFFILANSTATAYLMTSKSASFCYDLLVFTIYAEAVRSAASCRCQQLSDLTMKFALFFCFLIAAFSKWMSNYWHLLYRSVPAPKLPFFYVPVHSRFWDSYSFGCEWPCPNDVLQLLHYKTAVNFLQKFGVQEPFSSKQWELFCRGHKQIIVYYSTLPYLPIRCWLMPVTV